MSLPVSITDGPLAADGVTVPVDSTTPLTLVSSDAIDKVKVLYPDPTVGVANPFRWIRVDMLPGTAIGLGANIHATYTSPYDGSVRPLSTLVTATKAPNAGAATLGAASAPFPTPAS